MCLIVFTPNIRRATIRKSVLERGFDKNRDGAGFAYLANGRVVVSKGYDEFAAFWAAYRAIVAVATGPVLIHFRWSTIGSENLTNTQPSVVTPDHLVMAHNGTFSGLKADADKHDLSDSVALARLLGRLGWTFPYSRPQIDLLRALCDDSSKLVFLASTGRYLLINESEGKWSRGAWYSDGGDVLEGPAKWTPTNSYRNSRYDDDDGDFDMRDQDIPDDDNGKDVYGRPWLIGRLKQRPTMGGLKPVPNPKRAAMIIGLEQKMGIFAAHHKAKHFVDVDPATLNHVEWLAWSKLKDAMVKASLGATTLTS